jgi:hypothetical protein
MHRVIDTILTLFDLDLGGTTDPDYRDAAAMPAFGTSPA